MTTAQEREDAFRRDFAELLAKHGAEIEITADGPTCESATPVVVVTMYAIRESRDVVAAEFTTFKL